MVTMSAIASGCFALLILSASPAAAQATFGELPSKVRLGQKVIVYDDQGNMTTGTVERVSATELVLGGGAALRTFKPEGVQRVKKPGPIWDGAVKGALIGFVPGVLVAAQCEGCGGFMLLTTAIGTGIGVAIDAAVPPKTLFRRNGAPGQISMAPILGKGRRGVAASLRF